MPFVKFRRDPTLGYYGFGSNLNCRNPSVNRPLGFLGEPAVAAAPVFRFECPIGCPPHTAAQCRGVVHRAIRDGIRICIVAATALEANPRTQTIRDQFRRLFGHDPSRPVPWANNAESEMLHLIYGEFFRHIRVPPNPDDPQERRRDNAHCYEAFALRAAGHTPDRCDICRCRRRPA